MTDRAEIDHALTELVGQWIVAEAGAVADETCRRIEWLTTNYLTKVAQDGSGWETLYRDPADGRYWALTYTRGEMQGGGPPALFALSVDQAEARFSRGLRA